MKLRIFISYTSRDKGVSDDTLAKARSLFSDFSHVYVDRFACKSKWHPQLVILSKVFFSHLVVVIDSRSVYYSPWVLLELLVAKLTLTPIIRLSIESLAEKT